jgi:hypothetical protein
MLPLSVFAQGKPAASILASASEQARSVKYPATDDYLSFLSVGELQALMTKDQIETFGVTLKDLPLWQKSPFADTIRKALGDPSSSMAAEALFIIDKPKKLSGDELDLRVLRSFTAFSTMKGLLAYSESKKIMETFIFDSYRVASLDDKKPLPDPVFDTAPSQSSFVIYQKEEQMGDVYSQFEFDRTNGIYTVSLNNLTPMYYLIFQLVPPHGLHTFFVVVPTADKILVYGVTTAETPRLFGLERTKQKSFFDRMKALAGWFTTNLTVQ